MKQIFSLIGLLLVCNISIMAQWASKAAGMPSTPQLGINQMIAVDDQVAWGLAFERNNAFSNYMSNFTRTVDGGKHWKAGDIHAFSDQVLLGIAPISGTKAYVISSNGDFEGKVLRTMNGGHTWSQLTVAPYPVFYQNIYFFNAMDGVVLGDTVLTSEDHYMVVFITHNGGNSWTLVPNVNLPVHDITENWYIFSSTGVGNNVWSVSTKGRVWKSADKGLHWVANQTHEPEAVISNIKMRDALHGLWGINDVLYRTNDGGITWQTVNVGGTFFTFGLAYVPSTASTWVSTGGDTSQNDDFTGALHGLGSSYSTDDGDTWITIDTAIDHLAIAMVSPTQGYCGGFNTGKRDGVFNYIGHALGPECGNRNKDEIISKGSVYDKGDTHLVIYPNPISNGTTISFTLSQLQNTAISIFDLNGRMIKTLADAQLQAGTHQMTWDTKDGKGNTVSAGVYFLRMDAETFTETRKLIVVR